MISNRRQLVISGSLFTIILFLWPIFMAISQPQGSDAEQLQWVGRHLILYKAQFFFAFLLSPALLYLMTAQLSAHPGGGGIGQRIGWIFLGGYLVLNSIPYASQIILVPQLIQAGRFDHAQIWYFGSATSVVYFLNQMGYCFWAIGTILLFFHMVRATGIARWLAFIYLLSVALSIAAFSGLILASKGLNSLTLHSGLALIPVGILTIIWGFRKDQSPKKD